jgi:hypothetical protein
MSFKITGTVKYSHQFDGPKYTVDLNVTEVQPEPRLTLKEKLALKAEAAKVEEPTTYTVEYQGRTSKLWEQSYNTGIDNPYTDFEAARYDLLEHRAKGLNYRIKTAAGICVYFDAVPEVPSTFVVEFEEQDMWYRSNNKGLHGITFATRAAAEEAMETFGNYGLDYRVTEVPATVDAVPEVEPSTFVVDVFINAEWIRSENTGLGGIRFATRAKALEAIIEYGNIDSVKYRVTEVIQ